MAKVLTAKAVEKLKPRDERQEIPDGGMSGLYLVVQPSGAKSWAVRYRHQGTARKYTIGKWPAINLAAARELGGKAIRAIAEGRDPGREKILSRTLGDDDFEAVAGRFLERYAKQKTRERTWRETGRILNTEVLPGWKRRSVHQITRRDVLDLLDRVVDRGSPIMANRVLAVLRKLFAWCADRDIIQTSPCTGVKPPSPAVSRDRVLSDAELRLIWGRTEALGQPFGPMIQLLILTAQRRDEIAKLAWSEIDLESRLWMLPRERVKNNQPHRVPLSSAAMAVLESLTGGAGPYVLSRNGTTPLSGFSKAKRRIDALLPETIPHWTFHDLRRTAATRMARLGVALPVIEKILNHTSGSFAGMVGVYQRHDFADEKREALELWGKFVLEQVSRDRPGLSGE